MCMICLPVGAYAMYVPSDCVEQKRAKELRELYFGWSLTTMWVLKIEPESSVRTTSVVFKFLVISLVHLGCI